MRPQPTAFIKNRALKFTQIRGRPPLAMKVSTCWGSVTSRCQRSAANKNRPSDPARPTSTHVTPPHPTDRGSASIDKSELFYCCWRRGPPSSSTERGMFGCDGWTRVLEFGRRGRLVRGPSPVQSWGHSVSMKYLESLVREATDKLVRLLKRGLR